MLFLNQLLNCPPAGETADNWTFADFAQVTAALSEQLHGRQAVALWFDDAARFASALLAAWQAGADVYLPPNTAAENLNWAEQNGCLWISDQSGFPRPHLLYREADESARPLAGSLKFAIPPQRRVWLKTSGSSGEAKIIGKTAAQLLAEAHTLASVLPEEWRGADVHGSVSPQHLYGLSFRIFAALAGGWRLGRGQCRYPEDLIARSQRPCVWIASPAVLNRLGDTRDWARLRRHVRGIVSAGGMLPESVAQQLKQQLGFYPTDIYGSTETGVAAYRHGSGSWTLFPEVEAQADGSILSLQSPWTDGIQYTADSAEINGRELILHGRSDRIIKLEDKRVSLNQIEHGLLEHEWVADVHCGRHPRHGRIAAWTALSPRGIAAFREQGRAAVLEALKHHCAQTQDTAAIPRYWCLTAALPRNPQAKIRQADFEQAFTETVRRPDWQAHGGNEADGFTFSGRVPLALPYFGGHFAAFPLLPGVVEMEWALDLAAQFDWGGRLPKRLENVKYQRFVRPHDEVWVHIRYDADKDKVYFSLQCDGQICASGRAAYS